MWRLTLLIAFALLMLVAANDADVKFNVQSEGTDGLDCEHKAANGDRVSVHYAGRLARNGREFDNSHKRGKPFTFVLGARQVIPGWDMGVKGACKGEKRKLTIPSRYGYGARGAGRAIPGHATLEFDVEIVDILPAGAPPPPDTRTTVEKMRDNWPSLVAVAVVILALSYSLLCTDSPDAATPTATKTKRSAKHK